MSRRTHPRGCAAVKSSVTEACPVCDTLWRLYGVATDNHHTLVGKRGDARDNGEHHTLEILTHEITIAESALGAVRRELRRHERSRHGNPQEKAKPQGQEQKK